MADVYSALDIGTSASLSEGFPNVVGEAMACGVPCVVADCGDSARVVGDTGIVVPSEDVEALARGWETTAKRLTKEGAETVREQVRARIVENFGVEQLARRTLESLESIA